MRIGFRELLTICLVITFCASGNHLNAVPDARTKQRELQVKKAISHGNYDAAIRFATDALQLTPDSSALLYGRSIAYYRKGDLDNAIKDLNQVIRLKPTVGGPYVDRGSSYARKGWSDKALNDFNQAIRLGPRDARAYCDRADLEEQLLHQPDKALADYNQAIRLAPNSQRAYFNRGTHFIWQHDYASAIADSLEPSGWRRTISAHNAYRAYAYAKQGDRAAALANATTALRFKPMAVWYMDRAIDLALRAKAHKIMGQPELALRDLREAVRLAPRYPPANGELAWFLATCPEERFRNGTEAVSLAKKACEIWHWENSESIDDLAAAYAEAGDFDQATKYEQQSLNDRSLATKEREDREKRLQLFQQRKAFRDPFSLGNPDRALAANADSFWGMTNCF